jgi:hypothetical protein
VEWWRVQGIDYGYAAPWAVEWIAQDQDGRAWVYRELYRSGVIETEQARLIQEAERGGPPLRRFADPAMWSKTGSAPSPAVAYDEAGVHLEKAINDRVSAGSGCIRSCPARARRVRCTGRRGSTSARCCMCSRRVST